MSFNILLLQNSFPVWEDFNLKAGRMHAALRLDLILLFYKKYEVDFFQRLNTTPKWAFYFSSLKLNVAYLPIV